MDRVSLPFLSVTIRLEGDVVLARQRARSIARLLGFDVQDQTRLATATSEIARNAFEYARGGQVDFVLEGQSAPQILLVRVSDHGPGIRERGPDHSGRIPVAHRHGSRPGRRPPTR